MSIPFGICWRRTCITHTTAVRVMGWSARTHPLHGVESANALTYILTTLDLIEQVLSGFFNSLFASVLPPA